MCTLLYLLHSFHITFLGYNKSVNKKLHRKEGFSHNFRIRYVHPVFAPCWMATVNIIATPPPKPDQIHKNFTIFLFAPGFIILLFYQIKYFSFNEPVGFVLLCVAWHGTKYIYFLGRGFLHFYSLYSFQMCISQKWYKKNSYLNFMLSDFYFIFSLNQKLLLHLCKKHSTFLKTETTRLEIRCDNTTINIHILPT